MQGHLSQHNHDAAPAFAGQPLPNRRLQIAHREIQANAPTRTALGTRFSVIRRAPSNYERQCQWDIEEAFKTLKGDLAIRPIFHHDESRIEAHIFVAFLAYCMQITLTRRLHALAPGLTARSALEKAPPSDRRDERAPTIAV